MGGGFNSLQQMQLLQQQQMAAMMRGQGGGAPMGGGNDFMQQMLMAQGMGGGGSSGGSEVRLKGKAIVDSIQALLEEHDKCVAESASLKQQVANSSEKSSSKSNVSEDKITRLEEKIETLMVSALRHWYYFVGFICALRNVSLINVSSILGM